MNPKNRSLIVAYGQDNFVIADNEGNIPWHLPDEYKHFKDTTTSFTLEPISEKSDERKKIFTDVPVIMGRKNYESLPQKFRPLPHRKNIILTKNLIWEPEEKSDTIQIAHTLWEALDYAEQAPGNEIFCIGGAEIYSLSIEQIVFHKLYLTCVHGNFEGSTIFPIKKLDLVNRYKQVNRIYHQKDEKHSYSYTISEYHLR